MKTELITKKEIVLKLSIRDAIDLKNLTQNPVLEIDSQEAIEFKKAIFEALPTFDKLYELKEVD